MTSMKYLLLIVPIALSCISCVPDRDSQDSDLEDALELLDKEIEKFPQTMSDHYRRIRSLHDDLMSTSDVDSKLRLYSELVGLYANLSVDTLAMYSEQMLTLAGEVGDKDSQMHAVMALSTVAQMKEDFLGALNRIEEFDVSGLSDDGLLHYYHRAESVYYSMFVRAFNAPGDIFLNHQASYYREKLTALRKAALDIDSTSFKAYQIRISELRDGERYAEALEMLKSVKHMADNDSRLASWHRYNAVLYDFLKEPDKRLVHLAMASVYNLREPTLDNLSLISLARSLRKRGELEEASHYITLAMTNSFKYKQVARMSYAQSASNKIMDLLAQKEKASRRALQISLIVLALLLAISVYALIYNFKLRLRLEDSYRQLREADMIKNNYLFEYMVSSASYIDSADLYHKELRKMAKKDGIDKVYDVLKLPSRFEDDKRRFYAMFDENFLSMFPSFVDRVNEMMKDGFKYHIVRSGQMPVELRVLAIMRMGMTDSMKIARFMSYTISTVYTYRSRAAEKSKYSRDEFERKLMQIPLE